MVQEDQKVGELVKLGFLKKKATIEKQDAVKTEPEETVASPEEKSDTAIRVLCLGTAAELGKPDEIVEYEREDPA